MERLLNVSTLSSFRPANAEVLLARFALVRTSLVRTASAHRWGILATIAAFVVYLIVYATDPYSALPGGDGHYSWLFARSLAFDGDIDFTNDYRLCGDPFEKNILRGTSHPDNPFYAGPALFWTPILWIAKHVVTLPAESPLAIREACAGRLVRLTLFTSPVLAALTAFFSYLSARFVFAPQANVSANDGSTRQATLASSDASAAIASALIGLATPTITYAAGLGSYSHIYAAFGVSLLLWASFRMREKPTLGRIFPVAGALALVTLQRTQMFTLVIVPLSMLWTVRNDIARAHQARAAALIGAGALLGVAPALALGRYFYGRFGVIPQGHHYVHFTHAHPWLTLFAPHGGLFQFMPAAWLSVAGAMLLAKKRTARFVAVPLLVAFALELWISSTPLDWGGSWSVGARRLLAMNPILVFFAAHAIERVTLWLRKDARRALRTLAFAMIVPVIFASVGGALGYIQNRVSAVHPMSSADLFAVGTTTMSQELGDIDLPILPAELVFAARYRMPPRTFRSVIDADDWFVRDYAKMDFRHDEIPVTGPVISEVSRGFALQSSGLELQAGQRARIVFSAAWPFATSIETKAIVSSNGDLRVRLGVAHALGNIEWAAPVTLTKDPHAVTRVPLPQHTFDSGLVELYFSLEGAPSSTALFTALRIRDENTYRPPFE